MVQRRSGLIVAAIAGLGLAAIGCEDKKPTPPAPKPKPPVTNPAPTTPPATTPPATTPPATNPAPAPSPG